jgi:hypothetical protein
MRPAATTAIRWGVLAALGLPCLAAAQDIEPRAFANTPVGVNFLLGGYAWTRGALSTDPSIPLERTRLQTSSLLLGYAHAFDLFGMSAKVDAYVPFTWLSGDALLAGAPIERTVSGFGDPRFRVSVNFLGAPALTLDEFEAWRQDLILGASFQVSVPVGQYDPARVVNLGTNRWSFRPELGASKAFGPFTLELTGAATFFTDNADFAGGSTRAQAPILSVQAHGILSLGRGTWASLDATWFTGGQTTVDGVEKDDRLSNWRVGATLSVPLDRNYSLRFYGSRGVSARTRNDYDLVGIAVQYRCGGGL